jgi:protein-L-isoaspartate(D-aspartate) O-methyltransferase
LLADAFAKGGWERVTRLYRNRDIADKSCWVRGPEWCLAYD